MKALVIAGGVPQKDLLTQLKNKSIETVLIDGNENCVARSYTDIFYKTNIFDIDAVKEIAVKEKVDFIITVCADQVLVVVAQVSELLGLPFYISYSTALNVSDKIRMKKIFIENGVPTSKYLQMEELDLEKVKTLRYPLVVKPVDAYSSRGVRKVTNEKELLEFYNEAKQISRSGGVIVEEFVSGEEISVDAFIIDGKAHLLCVSNSEKILDADRFVICRGKVPVNVPKETLDEIADVAQKIADGFGLINSPLLIQMIFDGEHVSVLEFCARTGGNTKYLLIKNSCGVDVIKAAIDLSLGVKPNIIPVDTGNKYVVNDFMYCQPGEFDHLEGFDELLAQGIINEYHAIKSKGHKITGLNSSSDRVATVNIVAKTKEELNNKINTINKNVKIVDPNGKDLMRHDLIIEVK